MCIEFKELLLRELSMLAQQVPLYLAGGAVRDILLGRVPSDLDLVCPDNSLSVAGSFASSTGGTLVPLDESEGVVRVVAHGHTVDFSRFRAGALTIEDDLKLRDFTANAIAISFNDATPFLFNMQYEVPFEADIMRGLIDPLNGAEDLKRGVLKATGPSAFINDPLRILRAFRFSLQFDLTISPDTSDMIRKHSVKALCPAPERINYELTLIMQNGRAGDGFRNMNEHDVLSVLIPETKELAGVKQPDFHHLDVLEHSLAALSAIDNLVAEPEIKFPYHEPYTAWLSDKEKLVVPLKWAAFTHDFGKPRKKARRGKRITFYNHDAESADMARNLAERLCWSNIERDFTITLVRLHMRPFHLLTPFRRNRLTRRAMTRLLRHTGKDYPALFLLAMADSMAGCGPLKPDDLDDTLAALGKAVHEYFEQRFQPAVSAPKLLNGRDIMKMFDLAPGPVVGRLLRMLEEARMEGTVSDRQSAEKYVRKCMRDLI